MIFGNAVVVTVAVVEIGGRSRAHLGKERVEVE